MSTEFDNPIAPLLNYLISGFVVWGIFMVIYFTYLILKAIL